MSAPISFADNETNSISYDINGKTMFTLHENGRFELGEGIAPEFAASAFWQSVIDVGKLWGFRPKRRPWWRR